MKEILFIVVLLIIAGCSAQIKNEMTAPAIQIDQIQSPQDKDQDGQDDFSDIVEGARMQIGVVTAYDTAYYAEAYPPADRGACADVIWRAFKNAGYDFKYSLDQDMQSHPEVYPSNPQPDENINFRRVQNIRIFFERHAQKLTNEIVRWNKENLKEWQGGDIVTYAQIPGGLWHIAIISPKRRPDGVPLLIHNYGHGVKEDDYLLNWPTEITGHYRFVLTEP